MKWKTTRRATEPAPLPAPNSLKPRNPHVAASRFRKAGAHGTGRARADALRELRREVKDLQSHGP